MTCDIACKSCSGSDKGYALELTDYPQNPISKNTLVIVNVKLTSISLFAVATGQICLYDMDKGLCIGSQFFDANLLPPGQSLTFTFSFFMQDYDMHLNLSAISTSPLLGNTCESNRSFFVELASEPGVPYICDGTVGCRQSSNGNYPDKASCIASGCISGSTACKSDEMKFMGMCVPKSMVLVGMGVLVVSVMK